MNNQKILEKAIKKAVGNGWKPLNRGAPTSIQQWRDKGMVEIGTVYPERDDDITWVRELEGIIFNHDFAKAVWGEELPEEAADYYYGGPDENYLWHLQQMVISDDPIKYLGDNI